MQVLFTSCFCYEQKLTPETLSAVLDKILALAFQAQAKTQKNSTIHTAQHQIPDKEKIDVYDTLTGSNLPNFPLKFSMQEY